MENKNSRTLSKLNNFSREEGMDRNISFGSIVCSDYLIATIFCSGLIDGFVRHASCSAEEKDIG
jgi:hypothetical protein